MTLLFLIVHDVPYNYPGTDTPPTTGTVYFGNIHNPVCSSTITKCHGPLRLPLNKVGLDRAKPSLMVLVSTIQALDYANAISSNTTESNKQYGQVVKMVAAYAAFANGGISPRKPIYTSINLSLVVVSGKRILLDAIHEP